MKAPANKGFTLLEVLVSIATSTVIIGGFFIAFSSLDQVSKLTDLETKAISRSNNVRILIHKILAGASNISFENVNATDGKSYDVLYYYKWEKDAAGLEQPVEYGYFFTDSALETEPNYRVVQNPDGSEALKDHLYFRRLVGDTANPVDILEAKDFDYDNPSRFVVMEDVENFYASISHVDTSVGLPTGETAAENVKRYNIDYQITASYDTGAYSVGDSGVAEREQKKTIFKGSTYSVGRVTEG